MSFFDMGPLEVVLILIVALITWGPGKIPEIARTLGRIAHTLRKATSELTTAMTKELNTEEGNPPQSRANSGDKTNKPSDVDGTEPNNTETTSPRD